MNVEDQRLQLVGDAEIQEIKLDEIKANPYQPRKTFDEVIAFLTTIGCKTP